MKHSPHLLFCLWYAAATFGALLGIAGMLGLILGVMA